MTEPIDLVDAGCDEAGAALLGCALHGSGDACDAIGTLRLDDLTDTRQRCVLEAMKALIAAGVPLDPVTVIGKMRSAGAEVRMPAGRDAAVYLADLMERALPAGAEYHLQVVQQHSFRRQARVAGERIAQAAGRSSLSDLITLVGNLSARVVEAGGRAGASE